MKRVILTVCAVLAISCLATTAVFAQTLRSSVALHVGEASKQGKCAQFAGLADCDAIVTSNPNFSPDGTEDALHYVYLLGIPNGVGGGVKGVEAGIWYEFTDGQNTGIKVFQFSRCADQDFSSLDWPAPNSHTTMTWAECAENPDSIRVAGYFYIGAYSPALMQVTPRSNTGTFRIVDCAGAEQDIDWPARSGWVSIGNREGDGGSTAGCNPCLVDCGVTATESHTWGHIKKTLGNGE